MSTGRSRAAIAPPGIALRPSRQRRCSSRSVWIAVVGCCLAALVASTPARPQPAPPSPTPDPPDPFGNDSAATSPGKRLPERSGGGIFLEQDSVLPWVGPWGGDQNYTMGLAFQGSGNWVERKGFTRPLKTLDGILGTAKAHQRLASSQGTEWIEDHALTFGHTAFTPSHLEISTPILDDRPYASLLFLTVSRATVDPYGNNRIGGRMIKTDLTIGVLGLRIGKYVQTRIHTERRKKKGPGALTPYDPMGWPHQISDGGEATAKYTTSYWQNVSNGRRHDFTIQTEASLGYYTNAAAGVALRAGFLRSEWWTFTSNPLTAANQAYSSTNKPERNRRRLELYAFGALRGRAVLYNALLQGQYRHSDVTFNDAQIEHVIREWEFGSTLGWRGVNVVASVVRRSAEYNVGSSRAHTWGGGYLVWRKPTYART